MNKRLSDNIEITFLRALLLIWHSSQLITITVKSKILPLTDKSKNGEKKMENLA